MSIWRHPVILFSALEQLYDASALRDSSSSAAATENLSFSDSN